MSVNYMKSWTNIFNECELVVPVPEDFYVIHWSIHNNCVLLKNGVSIVDDPQPIFEKYNIFEAKNIVVDLDSFREEVNRSIDHIRQIIVEQYCLSYIKKIVLEKTLRYYNLERYLDKWNCSLLMEEEVFENCYIIHVKDNLGDVWKIDARFHEKIDDYWSRFEIIGKI